MNTSADIDSHRIETETVKLQLAEAQRQKSEIETEIFTLKEQLAAKEKTAQSGPVLTSQQKAALAKKENTIERWKLAIDAMIKVAVRCGEEGKKPRQQPEFNAMFNELDAELSDTQMEFFRKCLPDGHIDREGGSRGKC